MCGLFAEWQPRYAAHGVPTFPVEITAERKKPLVKHFGRIGKPYSDVLAKKFPATDSFGFVAGPRSKITVIDIDTPDERVLADQLTLHGTTPLIVRTGRGGFHLYYRHDAELRRVRHGQRLDLLGHGLVVAAPSLAPSGRYEVIQGTLDDLDRLPIARLKGNLERARPDRRQQIPEGQRNNNLFNFALGQARYVDDLEALIDVVSTLNMDCEPPLPDAEVIKASKSAWRYEQRGHNLVGHGRAVVMRHVEIDQLAGKHPDSFALLTILKRHHWGRDFVIANAMAKSLGWTLKRFQVARRTLIDLGFVVEVHPAERHCPAVYSFRLSDSVHQ